MTLIEELEKIGQRTVGHCDNRVYYYQHRNGKLYFINRPFYIPIQPGSPGQLIRWNKFKVGVQLWHNFQQATREYWNQRVEFLSLAMTGYNYFLSKWLKGKLNMVKNIFRGVSSVINGIQNITVPAVDIQKSVLTYNSFLGGTDIPSINVYGIEAAFLLNATTIQVKAWDSLPVGNLLFSWTIIEYA